jgi:hypothetical protein
MATDCSLLSAFVFTSKPLGRKHAVGVSKSSELFRVSAPTHKHPTGMPDGPPLRRAIASRIALWSRRFMLPAPQLVCLRSCPCGEGRVGWACGTPDWDQLSAPQWVWERYGESVPLLFSRRTIGQKETRRCRRGYRLLIPKTPMQAAPAWGQFLTIPRRLVCKQARFNRLKPYRCETSKCRPNQGWARLPSWERHLGRRSGSSRSSRAW